MNPLILLAAGEAATAPTAKEQVVKAAYLVAIVMFIFGIKRLGRVRTAKGGNALAGVAMAIAIVATLVDVYGEIRPEFIIGGAVAGSVIGFLAAKMVDMREMPEMVALFNGSGGAASLLVALAVVWPKLDPQHWVAGAPDLAAAVVNAVTQGHAAVTMSHVELAGSYGVDTATTLMLSIIVGGVTLTGSVVAWGKLSGKMSGNAVVYPGQHPINLVLILGTLGASGYAAFAATDPSQVMILCLAVTVLSLLLGVLLVIPIGGADMPVVISLLNSYSGIAASMCGFVLKENVLIVSGAMVGASGLILTNIMCKAMNRSLLNVLLGGFGTTSSGGTAEDARDYKNIKSVSPEDLAMLLDGVSSVIVVPGYGLAVAQAQHAVRELADFLEDHDCEVRYAIHPVAGRMPGHMNVLLAEANVPYEKLVEMDEINSDFKTTDVAIVLGANDVVNPAALDDPDSPLAGMPILNVHEARTVVIVKRSLSPGYAGVRNPLFELDNSMMLFSDAKAALQETLTELKDAA